MIPGTIIMAAFVATGGGGGGAGSVAISDTDVSGFSFTGEGAVATYKVDGDGSVYKNNLGFPYETWKLSGNAGDYDVRATLVSGDTLTGGSSVGVWYDMATDRSWSLTVGANGTKASTLLIEIRDGSTLVVLDTATISMSAESSDGI